MGLELYMVGLIVRDMAAAVRFYRQLGVDLPEGSEDKPHVQVKMGSLTLFLDCKPERWDPAVAAEPAPAAEAPGRYRTMLEFYLPSQAVLEAKYQEMVDIGYAGYRAPYRTPYNMIFAMLKDPDGNTVLLSADPAP